MMLFPFKKSKEDEEKQEARFSLEKNIGQKVLNAILEGNHKYALTLCEDLVRVDENNITAHLYNALLYNQMNGGTSNFEELKVVAKFQYNDKKDLLARAYVEMYSGMFDEAIKDFDKIGINIDNVTGYLFEGDLNRLKGKNGDAERFYNKAILAFINAPFKTRERYLAAERAARGLNKMNVPSKIPVKGIKSLEGITEKMVKNYADIFK